MSILNIGLSGLTASQKALEVTSNNIANSATAGYKSASAEFSAVYNGGQRGGVVVNDIRENFTKTGSLVNTGYALDMAITGKGFFVVSDNGRLAYTQAGQFGMDSQQNIVNANGNNLQGYGVDLEGNLIPGILTDLKVEATNIPAKATGRVDFALNLNASSPVINYRFEPASPPEAAPAGTFDPNDADYNPSFKYFDPKDGSNYNFSQSTEVYDSLGISHVLTQYFNHIGNNEWAVTYFVDGKPLSAAQLALPDTTTPPAPTAIDEILTQVADDDGNNMAAGVVIMKFSADGQLLPLEDDYEQLPPPAQQDNNTEDPYNVRQVTLSFPATGAESLSITLGMVKTTQFGSAFSMYANTADGYAAGEFTGVAVAENGMVFANFSNGAKKLQGQVVLASFANLGGLESGNKTLWYATAESGNALYGTPAEGSYGGILAGAYMGSNVDISEQLVDLMKFQQNYQANAKTISTSDQMMQVLFNAT